jgi:hypothetical protein
MSKLDPEWAAALLGPGTKLGDEDRPSLAALPAPPADYMLLFEALGGRNVALADDPADRVLRLHPRPGPIDGAWRAADPVRGSATSPGAPTIVGISRSREHPWRTIDLPDVRGRLWCWGERGDLTERTARELSWPNDDGEHRPTVVLSALRDEVWVLAMPAAEVLARILYRETGCPWIDLPILEAELADAYDAVEYEASRSGSPPRFTGAHVEVLRPEWLPGSRHPSPRSGQARTDLERLVALVPPPVAVDGPRDWTPLASEYRAPIPTHVRDLCDAYGRGRFVEAEESEFARHIDLYAPPGLHALDDADVALTDVTDIRGVQPPTDVRAVWFASLGADNELAVWLWRIGDLEGLAIVQEGYVACRVNATAAGLLLDVVENRGWYASGRGCDEGSGPMRFEPDGPSVL